MARMVDPYFEFIRDARSVIRSSEVLLSDPDTSIEYNATAVAERHQSEHFRRLVEGFQFSRWFFITYQGAVVAIVLLAAAWRRHERKTRQRRKTRRREYGGKSYEAVAGGICNTIEVDDANERKASVVTEVYAPVQARQHEAGSASSSSGSTRVSSSSSSTRYGDATPSPSDVKEQEDVGALSPLLAPADRPRSTHSGNIPRAFKAISWTRAALMYQPSPLPLLKRIIPPNSTTLVVLFLLGLNLFYLFYKIDFTYLSWCDILSDRSGLMFTANLPWLYLLAAKNQPLKKLTGDSYENLNLIHRRQGEYMCFLALVHFGGMLAAWYNFLRPEPFALSLYDFLTIDYIVWGIGAWFAYEVLYLTSLSSFREWCYELFLASHIFLQIVGLVTLWLHHFRAQPYIGAALVVFVVDRTIWRLGLKSYTIHANMQVMEDGETVKVSSNWPVKASSGRSHITKRFFGRNMQHGWLPSHHVFLTVPGIGKKHMWQAHPMTIASAAPGSDSNGQSHAWFNLIIRAKGGFSRELLEYARVYDHARVRLDGPYGSLHALEMLHAGDVAVIVAGGSGIAVAYPMLWDLLRRNNEHEIRVCLLWVVQDASHVTWIGNERLEELKELGCHVIVPPPSRKHGRPNVKALLRDAVDELSADSSDKIGVVVSGPDSMNRDVNNTCARLVSQGRDVEIAVEKFGW
ncbi:Putative ferric reductase transmembrane component-like domain-containing protein [Septoria linicola]|uniref:Ferric reductase transmembrane component-like domain-containing protein n=1 Tax=Septoria linicola TaxID=215465 RepID=A0A9Q9B0U6_9PEZI|nr:putative ferric reductase transmembrane component-like domain-containing protein [Septoria linicola]USW55543.1 Putative ferric reductase transmembrane component-like domain-containing protein [Septoria linicola]